MPTNRTITSFQIRSFLIGHGVPSTTVAAVMNSLENPLMNAVLVDSGYVELLYDAVRIEQLGNGNEMTSADVQTLAELIAETELPFGM